MKIVFDKVGSAAKPIELRLGGTLLKGTLQKSGSHQVALDARLSGEIVLDCDRCAKPYIYDVHSHLRLKLTNLVSEDKDDLDIIEFLDGEIDILYILQSEITSMQSTYHYCKNCDSDDGFEMEF